MQQLKASLKATDGPIDPVILRDIGSSEYIIVAGESRVKALLELGYPPNYKVPALLGDFDDRKALEYGLIDNYVRAPITAYEEALVVRSLVSYYDMSQRDIADKLGKTEQHISRLLSVFDLVEEVQNALHEGRITLGHAVEIHALLDSPKKQRKLLSEITERGLNVKTTRTRVRELLGEGEDWIIRPGEVWVSKEARVSIHPSGKGYKVDFSFATADEFDKIVTVLRNRLNGSGDSPG
jgi:ParB family chromosome partitioning protein